MGVNFQKMPGMRGGWSGFLKDKTWVGIYAYTRSDTWLIPGKEKKEQIPIPHWPAPYQHTMKDGW